MAKLSIKGIDFSFMQFEDVLDQISSSTQLDNLNSYLVRVGGKKLYLLIRESTSFAKIDIKYDSCYSDEEVQKDNYIEGIVVSYTTLFRVIHSYSKETLENLLIEINTEDPSYFKIITPTDRISLPHLTLTKEIKEEIYDIIATPFNKSTGTFQLSLFNDDKMDFIKGVYSSISFIEDEKKNNALALYSDRIVVSNNRHVFIYHYQNPVIFIDDNNPISLHRKSAKILSILSKKIDFDTIINGDQSKVAFMSPGFELVLNNSQANIDPPSKEDLDSLKPTKAINYIDSSIFLDTSLFFNNFYSSSQEYKALGINIESNGIRFLLKDSGIVSYNTCNVERFHPYIMGKKLSPNVDKILVSAMILNESLLKFLKEVSKGEIITLYMDGDHKAVYLQTSKREIYLAKLKE